MLALHVFEYVSYVLLFPVCWVVVFLMFFSYDHQYDALFFLFLPKPKQLKLFVTLAYLFLGGLLYE